MAQRRCGTLFLLTHFLLVDVEAGRSPFLDQSSSLAFAAGGFGKKSLKKPKKNKSNKRKKGGLLEDVVGKKPIESSQDEPVLDRWGLPPPTVEDIFPPMPPGTELIPATRDDYTLSEIRQACRDVLPCLQDLDRHFDENGMEINAPLDRSPMKLRLLHRSPPVLGIENFFTVAECLETQQVAMPITSDSGSESTGVRPVEVSSKTFALAQSKRTSTSWFCYYKSVPALLTKARYMLGVPLRHMEEPQIVRYKTGQEFSWHYDEVPPPQLDNGGQRLATLLVYLNTLREGGSTVFRDLTAPDGTPLAVRPVQGSALLFFPADAEGAPDDRTLHKGEVAVDEKRIIQMWIHEREYKAAVPPENRQADAVSAVEERGRTLGYIE